MNAFLDSAHEANYTRLAKKYPSVNTASDYRSACYIIALPEIFEHVGDPNDLDDWLFSWCYDYTTVEVKEDEEWDYSKDGRYYRRDCETDDDGESVKGSRFGALSGGARYLTLAAMELFNDTKGFRLGDITGMDDRLFKVFIRACQIRRGAKMEVSQ